MGSAGHNNNVHEWFMDRIFQTLATELNVQLQQITASVALLDEGATVPFISRYRKEVTGGMDDG